MTNDEIIAASRCAYMIPKKYISGTSQNTWANQMPEYIPAGFLSYHREADVVRLYCFGAITHADGGVRDGFCQSAIVPAGELGQYQIGSNNKHKRLETYIQRRQR